MREHGGGAVVNITSISAVAPPTLRPAYGTSKAGLAHLTKQLAVELASLGLRVNGGSSRPGRDRDGEGKSTPRKSAPTITTPFRSIVTASRRNWRKRCSSCAASARATSPGKFSPSTAAFTPPASDCSPSCAASGGMGRIG